MPETLIELEREPRAEMLARSMRGRGCAAGYWLTSARAEKMRALHAAGWQAVRYRGGWRYFHADAPRLMRLHEAINRLTVEPLCGKEGLS